MAFYKPRLVVVKRIGASTPGRKILDVLSNYLKAQEPKVAVWLRNAWNAEQGAVTYNELRDAILAGELSLDYLRQWQEDYARFVNEVLAPYWLDAMAAANRLLEKEYEGFVFDATGAGVVRWIDEHGTKLIKDLSQAQHEAIQELVKRAAAMGEFGPDELSRVIRPLIGMVPREAVAVERYYEALRKDGLKADEARKRAMNYAGRVHRHRAMRIARTELAFGYNRGADEGVRQAQAKGYMGPVYKRWLTAHDERTCEICGPLDEVKVPQNSVFPSGFWLPPAHPHCRCAVAYEES